MQLNDRDELVYELCAEGRPFHVSVRLAYGWFPNEQSVRDATANLRARRELDSGESPQDYARALAEEVRRRLEKAQEPKRTCAWYDTEAARKFTEAVNHYTWEPPNHPNCNCNPDTPHG